MSNITFKTTKRNWQFCQQAVVRFEQNEQHDMRIALGDGGTQV
jgi:hypothetical protein